MEDFINTKNNVIGIENNTIIQDPPMMKFVYISIYLYFYYHDFLNKCVQIYSKAKIDIKYKNIKYKM